MIYGPHERSDVRDQSIPDFAQFILGRAAARPGLYPGYANSCAAGTRVT